MTSNQHVQPRRPGATVLYDADCGFCRWALSKLLAWDRRRELRPLALQEQEAAELLAGMDERERMASWHLALADGGIASGGAAFGPLLRLLPAGALPAALAERVQGATDRAYRMVSGRRGRLGSLVTDGARGRAADRIAVREAVWRRSRSCSDPGAA
ncbi:MAG: DUF393 domain-containing protein [Solirubrobacterales bacterium]|nr:DUF393 domain-containing protein [Solirubrobacterales bacterium]